MMHSPLYAQRRGGAGTGKGGGGNPPSQIEQYTGNQTAYGAPEYAPPLPGIVELQPGYEPNPNGGVTPLPGIIDDPTSEYAPPLPGIVDDPTRPGPNDPTPIQYNPNYSGIGGELLPARPGPAPIIPTPAPFTPFPRPDLQPPVATQQPPRARARAAGGGSPSRGRGGGRGGSGGGSLAGHVHNAGQFGQAALGGITGALASMAGNQGPAHRGSVGAQHGVGSLSAPGRANRSRSRGGAGGGGGK